MLIAILALVASYLLGAIPFGWLIARAHGIDIFHAGSGNIGATNIGRVLGRKYGFLVFALDFAKGAVPVVASRLLPTEAHDALGLPDALRVGAGLCAFLGHMFPVYLGFRGGKGVATGAGVVFVLVPGPTMLAILAFAAVVGSCRIISLGSICAAGMLCGARLLSVAEPFGRDAVVVTGFCIAGTLLLIVKHRANIRRLMAGTENRLEDKPMFGTLARAIHVLALGTWFGSMVMFNFIVAPTLFFEAFPNFVESNAIVRSEFHPHDSKAAEEEKKNLATMLAGAAVGPVFPKFFLLQAICASLASLPAIAWWWQSPSRLNRWRFFVLAIAALMIGTSVPISAEVSALRVARAAAHPAIAEGIRAQFSQWHLLSLGLSVLTLALAGIALAMAAKMPTGPTTPPDKPAEGPLPSPGGG